MAKNNKQSNQKKSVLNKLGGLSKRSKFIVVVLIFAVLGGGYLTYKSFAATAAPAPITTLGANLRFSGDTGCTSNIATDASKNNAKVMNIYCPPNKSYDVNTAYTTTSVRWPQGTYKNCVMAKGVGKISVAQGGNSDFDGYGAKVYNINSPDYKEYCSYAITIGSAGQVFGKFDSGDIAGVNYPVNQDSTLLTISSMTKYWYAPGVAAAPNGGK